MEGEAAEAVGAGGEAEENIEVVSEGFLPAFILCLCHPQMAPYANGGRCSPPERVRKLPGFLVRWFLEPLVSRHPHRLADDRPTVTFSPDDLFRTL